MESQKGGKIPFVSPGKAERRNLEEIRLGSNSQDETSHPRRIEMAARGGFLQVE